MSAFNVFGIILGLFVDEIAGDDLSRQFRVAGFDEPERRVATVFVSGMREG